MPKIKTLKNIYKKNKSLVQILILTIIVMIVMALVPVKNVMPEACYCPEGAFCNCVSMEYQNYGWPLNFNTIGNSDEFGFKLLYFISDIIIVGLIILVFHVVIEKIFIKLK
jgi:hypothetical protein